MSTLYGYAGRLLRIDLTKGQITEELLDEATARKYLGGTGIGAKYLYEEVPPGVNWSDESNRFMIVTGPLGGTPVRGSGSISVVTCGAMTNGATSTQANGFLGAFLKLSGADGLIIQGKASRLSYLFVHDGTAEIRDASRLKGLDTWQTEDAIKKELGFTEQQMSVFSIGPAGENLVRFAALVGDRGHVAAHNGVGAVLGAKNLKAIAVPRGKATVPVHDTTKLSDASRRLFEMIRSEPLTPPTVGGHGVSWSRVYHYGMLQPPRAPEAAGAPRTSLVKNYTTNIYQISPEKLEKYSGEYIRSHFEPKPNPCWACQLHHCHMMRITEGPYTGEVVEEPEYEDTASWGPV
ncbi:MAG: aldehyde ferredoxin oxidoreductase N-terminal domain-containing protein, partial [Dehalococcoidia bacterium]|nr:aldehyde ferredoxin oxidoreductase N-terminal domain-containing protein [Dehalococcoidia bacterium]